jgi:hypothetical protein
VVRMCFCAAGRPLIHPPDDSRVNIKQLYNDIGRIDWLIDYDGVRLCLRTAATNGPIVHPPVICEHGEPWWWCRLGITPDSSTTALWQSCLQRHLGQVGGMDEGVTILPISIWNTCLICRKILRRGTSGFTSNQKESVLRILSPRQGLNPRPLGPVASTLTTTSPGRLSG